jgi:hypothetical protein
MPTLEEAMRDALQRQTPTRDPGDVFDRVADRRRRRAVTRKLGTIGLVAVVLGGTVGAFALLGHAFGTDPQPLQAPTASNGALVVSLQNEDGFFLYVLPPGAQDLAPAASAVAAGPDAMRYLTGTGAERDVQPAVSPDGTTVAYVRHESKDAPGALWTIGIDGSKQHQIVAATVAVEDPAWSPDGTWIAFTGVITDVRAPYLVHPDGSDLHVLPFMPESTVGSPSWSPDGTSIVFSASPVFGDGVSDLWVMASDGTDVRNLTSTTDVDETDPVWSPDGAWIAFATPEGIEQIPAHGGTAQVLVPASGVESDRLPGQPAWSPDGRYLAFAFGPTAPLPPVVYALPIGGTTAFPLAQGSDFAWQPTPANGVTSTPPVSPQPNLGLGYDVCRVTSMPITTGGAYVFTVKGDAGCPEHGDWIVGVDVDNDGAVDATYGPLKDCFFRCEAFAAPDVNGDGTSEIAVSNEGADGYGVWLFAISTAGPPTLSAINVEDPQGIGYLHLDPLEIAWVDVAGHFSGARCGTLDDGTATLIVDGGDNLPPNADLRSTTLVLEGSTATVVDATKTTIPLVDAPVPGHEFCGTPLYNSAAAFPESVEPGVDIGIGTNICDVSHLEADFDGDGAVDTAWVGTKVRNDRCPQAADGQSIAAVDLDGDGRADGSYDTLPWCLACRTFATVDFDADGASELIVLLQGSSTPDYGVYGAVRRNTESPGLYPIVVHPGNAAGGIVDGSPVSLVTGGDEGYSYAVDCEGFPTAPVLILWSSVHPVDGPGSDIRTIDMTKLRLRDGVFAVVDTQHFTRSRSDPPPFSQPPTACGVDWGNPP